MISRLPDSCGSISSIVWNNLYRCIQDMQDNSTFKFLANALCWSITHHRTDSEWIISRYESFISKVFYMIGKFINISLSMHGNMLGISMRLFPTNIAPEASHLMQASYLSATGWHRGGLHGRLPGGPQKTSSLPSVLSPDPLLCPLSFHFTGSGLQQPTWYLHTAPSSGTGSAGSLMPLGG